MTKSLHKTLLALLTLIVLAGALPTSTHAAVATVTVDMAVNNGTPTNRASGFLYGLSDDATQPPTSKFDALKPQQMRCGTTVYNADNTTARSFASRLALAKAYYNRITALGGKYHICVVDLLWGVPNGNPNGYGSLTDKYPGDGGNWTTWENEITSIAQYMINNGMTSSYIDIWNEPDNTGFWNRSQDQYREAWRRAYVKFRALIPASKFTGPSVTGYNATYMGGWLDYVKANNVVPNIFTWHFGDPAADAPNVRSLLTARSISVDSLMVNEYVLNCCGTAQANPGNTAWLISRLERAQVPGIHAVWAEDGNASYDFFANDGTLDHIMIKSGANYLTRGQWWAYKRYADITGSLVGVTPGGDIDGVAGKNAGQNEARMLLGNKGGTTGTIDVAITNLNQATFLIGSGYVRAVVEQLPHNSNNEVTSPTVIQDQSFAVVNNQITVSIPWNSALDGYAITLTPGTAPPNPGGQTVFTTQTPSLPSYSEGTTYELGMKFKATVNGQITALRFWKASGETGSHTGRIWSSSGTQLASVTFTGESGSGWQQTSLSAPLSITANTTYVVSTNINSYYAVTVSGLQSAITNGNLSSIADGANGVFGTIGSFPSSSYSNSNYFRDVVFVPQASEQTLFTSQTPSLPSYSEGTSYEMGMKFKANVNGQIKGIRFWKASGETGSHTGRIWSSSGTQLASVTFTGESGSGWQQATLSTPLNITANTTYVVSVNINSYYAVTVSGLQSAITNGNLSSIADGANGVFGTISNFPSSSYSNSNYFRDVVFLPGS